MIDAELDALARRAKAYVQSMGTELDPQLATLLHRYLCILLTANIDRAIQLILAEFARTHGSEELHRFVSKKHMRGTNYNTERLVQTLGLFRTQWAASFLEEAIRTGLKEQIDSLYGLRNSISHGELVNVSRPTLEGYLVAHKKTIELLKATVFQ